MNIRKVGTAEAARSLSRLLKDVAAGTEVVITTHGQPVAVLVSCQSHSRNVVSRLLDRSAGLRGLTLQETYLEAREELEARGALRRIESDDA